MMILLYFDCVLWCFGDKLMMI